LSGDRASGLAGGIFADKIPCFLDSLEKKSAADAGSMNLL